MSLLSVIEEMIISEYKVTVRGDTVVLREKKESACKQVRLEKNGQLVVLRFDQEDTAAKVFPFFHDGIAGLTKMCDYLLFYRPRPRNGKSGDELFVFLCDMKAGPPSKALEQLRTGHIFAEFLINTAIRQNKRSYPAVQYRGLVFSAKTTKGLSNPKKNKYSSVSYSKDLGYLPLSCNYSCNLTALCF